MPFAIRFAHRKSHADVRQPLNTVLGVMERFSRMQGRIGPLVLLIMCASAHSEEFNDQQLQVVADTFNNHNMIGMQASHYYCGQWTLAGALERTQGIPVPVRVLQNLSDRLGVD